MQESLRKMLICVVVISAVAVPSAVQAGTLTGVIAQLATGPPTWIWDVSRDSGAGDPATPSAGDELIFDMGAPWTTDISQSGWSRPTGWRLDQTRLDVIRFHVTEPVGSYGQFSVTPYGPVSDTPSNHPGASGPTTGVVPEASTMALLGLGLFAGALLKRRKQEE